MNEKQIVPFWEPNFSLAYIVVSSAVATFFGLGAEAAEARLIFRTPIPNRSSSALCASSLFRCASVTLRGVTSGTLVENAVAEAGGDLDMISAAFFRSSASIRSRSTFSFFTRSSSSCAFRAASSNETPDETLAAPRPFFAPSLLAVSPPSLVAPSLLPVPVGVVVPEPEAARMLALLVVRGTAGVGVIARVPMTGGGTGVEGFDICGVTGFEVVADVDGLSQLEKKSSASVDASFDADDARAEGSVDAVPSTYIRWGNLCQTGGQK